MTVRSLYRFAPLVLLLAAYAEASERHPATFEHPDDSLGSLIEFPELKGDSTAVLSCAAQVTRSGKMEGNGCYVGTAGDEIYITAINAAARKARLNPAMIDGQATRVLVQYQVEFRKAGDERSVTIYNHPGVEENVNAYGVEHIAAQRGLGEDEPWQKACPTRTRYSVLVRAHVSYEGKASSVSLVEGRSGPITQRCEQAIRETVESSVYTPAFADGEPVPSTFVEPFGI